MKLSYFDRCRPYAPFVLRLGLAAVVLFFSYKQFAAPDMWVKQIPAYVVNLGLLAPLTIIKLNAWFELLAGLALLAGFWTRLVGFLLFLHVGQIAINLGLGSPVGMRDVGLSLGYLAAGMFGPSRWSVDECCDQPEGAKA